MLDIRSTVIDHNIKLRQHSSSLLASTMSSSTSTSTRGASTSTSTSIWSPSTSTSTSIGGPSTSTSTKYSRTKLHNLEHFTKITGFTEMHRVKVKHIQQIVLDST